MKHIDKPEEQIKEIKDICYKWMRNICLQCGSRLKEGDCLKCGYSDINDFIGMSDVSRVVGELICMTGGRAKN